MRGTNPTSTAPHFSKNPGLPVKTPIMKCYIHTSRAATTENCLSGARQLRGFFNFILRFSFPSDDCKRQKHSPQDVPKHDLNSINSSSEHYALGFHLLSLLLRNNQAAGSINTHPQDGACPANTLNTEFEVACKQLEVACKHGCRA